MVQSSVNKLLTYSKTLLRTVKFFHLTEVLLYNISPRYEDMIIDSTNQEKYTKIFSINTIVLIHYCIHMSH